MILGICNTTYDCHFFNISHTVFTLCNSLNYMLVYMIRLESWFSKHTKNISNTNTHTSKSSLVHITPKFHQICLPPVTAAELIGVTLVYVCTYAGSTAFRIYSVCMPEHSASTQPNSAQNTQEVSSVPNTRTSG